MALKPSTVQTLKVAFASEAAANDLVAELAADASGGSLTPTLTTVTTTGDITSGGHVLLASGKVLKVATIQVVGAQQALVAGITTTYSAGSAPTKGNTQTISDSATPTVVELLQYCANLEGKVTAINTLLKTHGLEASA